MSNTGQCSDFPSHKVEVAARSSEICRDPGLGRAEFFFSPFSSRFAEPASRATLSGIEEFLVRLQAKICAPQFAGLFLLVAGILSYESYEIRELLICWLGFVLLFASITVTILGSMLAWHAAKHIVHWAPAAIRAASAYVYGNGALIYTLLVRSGRRVFSS